MTRLTITCLSILLTTTSAARGEETDRHWSFVPPVRPALPATRDVAWPRGAIDRFVLARLQQERISPSQPASKTQLIRRLTLDLTGLPPSPAEVDTFLADDRPDAYERLVDRLLASPRYGERMVWDWLDAARYADTNGYQGDPERTMWPWRDWVVQAMNANMPYDQFTIEQLAGDLLPDAQPEQILATGFNRNHMYNGEGGRIPEETRVENVMDRTETTTTVWLGLTVGCCRCHDHKFDPISQKEYFQFYAFFNNTSEAGDGRSGQIPPVLEWRPPGGAADAEPVKVMVMDETEPRATQLLARGSYNKPVGDPIPAGVPGVLPPLETENNRAANRLDLARWIVDPGHPLTARVAVNRYWQLFFTHGLVKTPEDFGVQGERPSHPELLDWLAVEFVRSGWDVKHMHRLIVTSATYRQSSHVNSELLERDPDNRLLARAARYRLPSWMIRDVALAASGLLVGQLGGSPVNPYQPDGIWAEATFGKKKYEQDHGEQLYRRSLYTFWRRIVGPTLFFDTASRQTCTVKQLRTNTPLHALVTLNDVTYIEAARALAERVLLAESETDARIETIFRRATARRPTEAELAILRTQLEELRDMFADDPIAAEQLLAIGEHLRSPQLDPLDHAAYTALTNLILNLDESLSRE